MLLRVAGVWSSIDWVATLVLGTSALGTLIGGSAAWPRRAILFVLRAGDMSFEVGRRTGFGLIPKTRTVPYVAVTGLETSTSKSLLTLTLSDVGVPSVQYQLVNAAASGPLVRALKRRGAKCSDAQ